MNDRTTQKDRVLQFLETQGVSKNKFYAQTGIANGSLDKKSGMTGDTIAKIFKVYPNVNLQWLITGEGPMLNSSTVRNAADIDMMREQYANIINVDPASIPEARLTPPSDKEMSFIPLFTYKEFHYCQGYVSIPDLDSCDGAGYIKTDSMYPLIKPGDIVCYKTANNTDAIHWGEMYVMYLQIDGEEMITLKYINKSSLGDDYVLLSGCNTKYHDKDVLRSCIEWKGLVKAYICYHTVF
ncbi:helix-turn-helix transcriptional regulator [Dysgonomonas sp. 511]|uniref:S24 family peptidase n=1 Tax=Dysgonomonas sp. 511 TaxID=2302930 RepID=UPI0013D86496|nr:helix-turn-helix transcriptional regulator [Dysgonomonas sp. 511]NDV78532.1 helix-turn-helix transcriptional regulator [Dysgonomonas sp. 511]